MMQIVITAQPEPLVTLDEAKVALGESGNDRNSLIEAFILAAQAELDGPKGWVGISVAEQSVLVIADAFEDPTIRLPGGPIIDPVVVTYLDSDGDEQTLDAAGYVLSVNGTLSLAAGASWPTPYDQSGAISVAYDVGIPAPEDDDAADPRISLMKVAIILHVRMTMDGVEPEKARKAIEAIVRPMWVPVL